VSARLSIERERTWERGGEARGDGGAGCLV